jgi:hypothetical protein
MRGKHQTFDGLGSEAPAAVSERRENAGTFFALRDREEASERRRQLLGGTPQGERQSVLACGRIGKQDGDPAGSKRIADKRQHARSSQAHGGCGSFLGDPISGRWGATGIVKLCKSDGCRQANRQVSCLQETPKGNGCTQITNIAEKFHNFGGMEGGRNEKGIHQCRRMGEKSARSGRRSLLFGVDRKHQLPDGVRMVGCRQGHGCLACGELGQGRRTLRSNTIVHPRHKDGADIASGDVRCEGADDFDAQSRVE